MNEKTKAILMKTVLELKKDKWNVAPDWEITLKGEGHVSLAKNIPVTGNLGDDQWDDTVETTADLKLASQDQVTFYPEFIVYANIFIQGGGSKDIALKMDADVAFTEGDFTDDKKIASAAKKISNIIEDYIETQYSDYIDDNSQDIINYKQGGWRADQDHDD